MSQPKDKDRLNGYKNNTLIYAVYNRPTSNQGTHTGCLCLLVGTFNPFTFKVIIDKCDPIAIYFVVWGSILKNQFI